MNKLMQIEKEILDSAKKDYPSFRQGDMVKVYYRIREKDKERIHPLEGIVLKIQGALHRKSFTLRRTAFDHKLNKTIGDEMFINAAFLVSKGREKEFDNIMDDLSDQYQDKMKFMYAGPLPVFNFVNIVIYPEEWEK